MVGKNETPEVIAAKQARAKSQVRVYVTHLAAAFVFGGGALLVLVLGAGWVKAGDANVTAMKDIFMTVLPIATGVITYWFADRAASKTSEETSETKDGDADKKNETGTK